MEPSPKRSYDAGKFLKGVARIGFYQLNIQTCPAELLLDEGILEQRPIRETGGKIPFFASDKIVGMGKSRMPPAWSQCRCEMITFLTSEGWKLSRDSLMH
jgi:hypothetical protein